MRLRFPLSKLGAFVCLACLGWLAADPARAQIAESVARKMGLETAWQAQIQLPRYGLGVVSTHIWAESQDQRKFAEVELPGQTIRISAAALDRRGKPLGIEEAKKLAQQQAALVTGKSEGFQVIERSIPQIKLVAVSHDGLVQTMDAESGKLIWSSPCGRTNAPAYPAAVSVHGISVIHGTYLYQLDWKTGKHISTRPLHNPTSNSVAVSGDIAFVVDFTGRVEAYGLGRDLKQWGYVILGRAVGPTASLQSDNYCAIASDNGQVYVFSSGVEPSVHMRYETSSPSNGSLAAGNNAFYAGSSGGVISKIELDDRVGRIGWELRTGQTITAPPLVAGEQVIVTTEGGSVFAIDDKTGLLNWSKTLGVKHAVGIAGKTLICTTTFGEVLGLDARTGDVLARSLPTALDAPVINTLNDRIYLITKSGQVQCLRPIGAELPTMRAPVTEVPTQPDNQGPAAETGSSPFESAPGNDPFGAPAGGDPFGTPAGGDPFGTPAGGDPFGGFGTEPAGGDPFGGDSGDGGMQGADPFGGNDPLGGSGGSDDSAMQDPFGSGF